VNSFLALCLVNPLNTVELANPFCLFKVTFMKARAKKLSHIRTSLVLMKYLWGTPAIICIRDQPSSMVTGNVPS